MQVVSIKLKFRSRTEMHYFCAIYVNEHWDDMVRYIETDKITLIALLGCFEIVDTVWLKNLWLKQAFTSKYGIETVEFKIISGDDLADMLNLASIQSVSDDTTKGKLDLETIRTVIKELESTDPDALLLTYNVNMYTL